MTQAAAKTGLGPTLLAALEQNYPANRRIVSDDLASSMLPFGMRALVWFIQIPVLRDWMVRTIEKKSPGAWGGLLCRKRYIDDILFEPDHEIEAIVNLGTGFDTRVYRIPSAATIPVWELDQPENIAQKQNRLAAVLGQIPTHIRLLPVDFDRDDLGFVLSDNGYSLEKQTFFIWEAVSQFLTETGLQSTLKFLSEARQGSRLVFTYILKDFIDGENLFGQEKQYQQFVETGVWLSGMHPEEVSDFLEPYGWSILEHLDYDNLAEKYVEPTGRALSALPIERLVLAVKN